jgi:MFS family permease
MRAISLVIGTPFFIFFGWLSDHMGRKRIMLAGCLLAAVFYVPIYRGMQSVAGSNVVTAASDAVRYASDCQIRGR